MVRTSHPELPKMKWPYLSSWVTNKKNKDTFFCSTFKVWESKVSLFFQFMVQGPRYWAFFPWRCYELLLLRFKRRNGHISAPGPQIKKLRTLSFLQLVKFEKVKYPHFLNLWLRGRHIGLFSRDDGTYSSSWGSKDKMSIFWLLSHKWKK